MLNLQRACENVIDIANHAVAEMDLGTPASARESFELLENAGIIPSKLREKMGAMIGFRNLVTHQYFRIDMNRVCDLVENDLSDLSVFANIILARF